MRPSRVRLTMWVDLSSFDADKKDGGKGEEAKEKEVGRGNWKTKQHIKSKIK